jgi:hypothetical protein
MDSLERCGQEVPDDFVAMCESNEALAESLKDLGCGDLNGSSEKSDFLGGSASEDVFRHNAGKIFVGTNPQTGSPCAVGISEDLLLQYRFDRADIEQGNIAGPEDFQKALFQNKLTTSSGGLFTLGCLTAGECDDTRLDIFYDGDDNLTAIEATINKRPDGRCEALTAQEAAN